MFLLTVEIDDAGSHRHIDVDDPAQAAAVINEINDSSLRPVQCSILEYDGFWTCPREGCSSYRLSQVAVAAPG